MIRSFEHLCSEIRETIGKKTVTEMSDLFISEDPLLDQE